MAIQVEPHPLQWVVQHLYVAGGDFNAGNADGFMIECAKPTPGDTDGDGDVDVVDLLELLGSWGPCPGCPADFDGDDDVDVVDLLTLLANWTL